MFMRDEDWARCYGQYGAGSVQVHWTESYGQRQWHIPSSMPFITKLASLGLELMQKQTVDLLYAHYVEPYGITAHIFAQATGLPFVMRPPASVVVRFFPFPRSSALSIQIFISP